MRNCSNGFLLESADCRHLENMVARCQANMVDGGRRIESADHATTLTHTARATQRNPATALSTTSRLSTQNRHFHRQIFKFSRWKKWALHFIDISWRLLFPSLFGVLVVLVVVEVLVLCVEGRECAFRESVSMRSDGLQLSRLVSSQESEGVRGKDEKAIYGKRMGRHDCR